MAYRIIYSRGKVPGTRQKGKSTGMRVLTAAAVLLLALGVRIFWTDGAAFFQRVLLPGDTGQAIETLAEAVTEGMPIGEAVTAFCREIVENAGLAG